MSKITIYGVKFERIADLFKVLGFSSAQSKSYVLQTFGSYENMTARKLKLSDPNQIRERLTALKAGGAQTSESDGLNGAVQACLTAAWSRLSESDRELIIQSTAIALKVSASELSERLKALASN